MATDYLSAMGGLQGLPNWNQARRQAQGDQLQTLQAQGQAQLIQAKLAQQAQEQERRQAYQTDVTQYLQRPDANGLAALVARYPEQREALKAAWDIKEPAQQQADLRQLGEVRAALSNGKTDIAIGSLKSRIAAEKTAGGDTSDDERILSQLESGDPAAVKTVMGMIDYHLASVVPDKAAALLKQVNPNSENFTLGPGMRRYDAEGKLVAEAPFAPQYRTVGEGQSLVEVGGGAAPQPGGSGDTRAVRNRNPGNIRDGAFARSQPGYQGADDGGFAIFADAGAGTAAQQALLRSYGSRGFDTVAKIINRWAPSSDGNNTSAYIRTVSQALGVKPTDKLDLSDPSVMSGLTAIMAQVEGGGTPTNGGAPSGATSGGARVIAQGAPKAKPEQEAVDEATVQFYADKVAAGGDLPALGSGKSAAAWRQAILKRAAQIQTGRGVTGGESNLAQADVKANRSALLQAQKTYTAIVGFEDTFQRNVDQVIKLAPKGVGGSTPVFNRWIQAGRKNISGDPAVSAFNVAVNTAANEYAKLASGASGGAVTSDSARHEAMEILNTAQTLPQLQAAIRQMKIDGHNRVLALDTQIKRLRGNISGAGGGGVAPPAGAVQYLKANPNLRAAFDAKYGKGAAAKVLGR